MKRKLTGLSRRYQAALRKHLKHGSKASAEPAQRFGRQAMATGLETLDLAKIHEHALITLVLPGYSPGTREAMVRRAGTFFAEAITPIEKTHRTAREANVRLNQMIAMLDRHSVDLADSNRHLKQEIAQRKTVEESLRKSERHYSELLEQSQHLQEQLRYLSRQLLLAQEEERKKISRELHDEIAQTLTGINVRLAALKTEATVNTKGLQQKISSTQRMVEKSVDIVHRFARELRPTVLDDLGLIPALHSFVKVFSKQTRVHVRLTVYAGVERLDNVKRTVLYRVTQEALTNVARHAHATRVDVSIQKLSRAVGVIIKDDGKSFEVERALHAKTNKRLGLLGMRERVEMVGGRLHIESAPGKGTTIRAEIPFTNGHRGAGFMKHITVLLAEDHLIVREGFRSLLKSESDIEVVGEAQTGRQAVALAKKFRPAVVVMDIAMPLLNGLEATRQIRQALPGTKVIILSAHNDDAYVEQAISFGAVGYLIKQTSSHDLSKAIREVENGNRFFSPSIAKRLHEQKSPGVKSLRKRVARLTSRELEVLQLIAEGSANKQVAGELNISIKTVEKHRQSMMQKLNIHDVAGLTRYAIGAGIIESSVQITIV